MLKSLLATVAICGLGASVFTLSTSNAGADPSKGSSRPLSKGEMNSTKGAGSTCNTLVCNTKNGCVLATSTYYLYHPHYQCYTSALTIGGCSNFGLVPCWDATVFAMPGCSGMRVGVLGANVSICGI